MTSTKHAFGGPITIAEQGSFLVGGSVLRTPGSYDPTTRSPAGQTLHGDHAYVFYQVPDKPRRHPLAFLHGNSQSTKTWETTPDGREGFQTLFLRRGYGIYVIDQPRRGDAGRSTVAGEIVPATDDQFWFDTFRVGIWPDYYEGVQFPRDAVSLDQYFRQITPNTGPFDLAVMADAVAALFARIGPGVLVSHSQGGGVGWHAAMKAPGIRGIVSYEPGSNFPFPLGEVPPPVDTAVGPLPAVGVAEEDFLKLTRIPIVIYYGDYIPAEPVANVGPDQWRARLILARIWAEAVNRRGGDVEVVHLPEIGIAGNTHFPFSDLNNVEIGDLMAMFLAAKGLD